MLSRMSVYVVDSFPQPFPSGQFLCAIYAPLTMNKFYSALCLSNLHLLLPRVWKVRPSLLKFIPSLHPFHDCAYRLLSFVVFSFFHLWNSFDLRSGSDAIFWLKSSCAISAEQLSGLGVHVTCWCGRSDFLGIW